MRGKGRDHVDRRLGVLLGARAAQRLAVDGDHLPGRAGQRRHPVHETALELRGVKHGQNVAEVIMRRRAVEKRPEPAQQIELLLAKARDINERLRPRQHRQKAQQQHLRERIDHLAGLPRVRQILEIVQENNRLVERRQLRIPPAPSLVLPNPNQETTTDFSTPSVCHELLHPIALRSGLIALLHRLGLEYDKPDIIPRKLNKEKQQAFIESYDNLLNSLADNEAVLFADAVHPTHAARPAGCWAPRQEKLAIEQTSGRERINIHGAIDLATGQTRMIEVVTVDAVSTIRLLKSIAALYPMLALIHVFLDNARYHHAKLVQEWLARPGCRIKLHFIPSYCPHLNPIERLWGLMHRNVTHNKCYATCAQFADATLGFLRETVPRNWADFCDSVTDNFRVINPKDFRVMT